MKILIVENEVSLINIIIDLFGEIYDFDACTDINSALKYVVENEPPNLVMLDLRMNGKNRNGFEVYDLIRAIWGESVPIAIVTGCDDELWEKATTLVNQDSNLRLYMKPFGAEDLEMLFNEIESISSTNNSCSSFESCCAL
jgi:DNA-binding response OmpR family regulator